MGTLAITNGDPKSIFLRLIETSKFLEIQTGRIMEKHLHRMWLHLLYRFEPFSLNRFVSENSPFNMQMIRIIVDALTFSAFFSLK